ncbi:hypothetical protein [Paraliobacillus salinarum]|uniref:hypothetical protein n=1 Tax=Paraliobacillus salinarum TaxID=1158996 RepID=UPI0015F6E207|nr:hypothetical protein [Paraliobacillus salinarum]
MLEVESEINKLEMQIEKILKKSKDFKSEKIKGENIFKLELLKLKIISSSESSKHNHFFILVMGVLFTLGVTTITGSITNYKELNVNFGIIVITSSLLFLLDPLIKKRVADYTYVIGLMDMLIERKKSYDAPQ